MNFLFLDSTAIVETGPGSPAYFSRFAIEHLTTLGHNVSVVSRFNPSTASRYDAVICEWANEEAYEAAASGLCKRLIVRMRGFDAHGPLDRMEWANVDALVYESPFLKSYVEGRFPGLRGFRSHVVPSGVDVANIPFKERKPGPVVAMVGRAVELKGYQLAYEWARQRPDIQLHVGMTMGERNPRLVEYLEHVRPRNVTMHGSVDTVKWLDEIDANFLLSASIWETLGYTIAEALAMGIKPLIHDTPGVRANWPETPWLTLAELNSRVFHDVPSNAWWSDGGYQSKSYRSWVERNLDAASQSAKFADIVLAPATRTVRTRDTINDVLGAVMQAISNRDLPTADQAVTAFRAVAPARPDLVDFRVGFALQLAGLYYAADKLPEARTWALRSMADEARPGAMCLLGEIALAEDDLEGAERWYKAAVNVDPVPSRFGDGALVEGRHTRLAEIEAQLRHVGILPGVYPTRFLIVVAVRNAEKYIGRCLESVKAQPQVNKLCVVTDDESTDATYEIAGQYMGTVSDASATRAYGFFVFKRGPRQHSLHNIVETIRAFGAPGDVVVILDGDDELRPDALENISIAYRRGAWLTYGNFTTSSGKPSWMPPYPQKVLRASAVRDYPWRVSHPKTFKIELFNHLTDEDFTHEGKWFETAGDVALMIPMLEMAAERAMYIPNPIYVYNDENPANDHRVDPDGQVRVRNLILSKPAKKRLEGL